MTKTYPNFLVEMSVWKKTLDEVYDDTKSGSTSFMYTLSSFNVSNNCFIGKITPQLLKLLDETYDNRIAYKFIIQDSVVIETYPNNLPFDFTTEIDHQLSMIKLAFWKTLGNPETYLVTEDTRVISLVKEVERITHVKIKVISPEEATKIINSIKI